jgi:hypothetical protein
MLRAAVVTLVFAAAAQSQVVMRDVPAPLGAARVASPLSFSALGARWMASEPVTLRLRCLAGAEAGEWKHMRADPDLEPGAGGFFTGTLTYCGPASDGVEYAVEEGDPRLLRFYFIDPGKTPPSSGRAALGGVVSRRDWGCPLPDGPASKSYTTVTHLIVHHTADRPPASGDFAAWVRAIWAYHVNVNQWSDIGYNYLVDPNGVVYEGRAGGDGVLGAHFSCINSGTMGVALLGYFHSPVNELPSAGAQRSLAELLAWRASALRLDPLGKAVHRASGRELDVISSHRDGNGIPNSCTVTACPGDLFYPLLASTRQAVAALLNAPLLSHDAEGGPQGWTATGLWHITQRRAAGGAASWWYGRPETGNYDLDGRAHAGSLESPPFLVSGAATLRFRSWYDTENDTTLWDEKYIEYSVDGAPWRLLRQIAGPSREWTSQQIAIPAAGAVRIRFRFDTIDGAWNHYEGWFLDDITVTSP